jgi:zinc-dependent metalloproteinase lipoprotein
LKRTIPGYNPARSTNSGSRSALRTTAVTYTLPVIVHVIHNGEAVGVGPNIAQGQVQSQLAVLNEDYRNTNADGALVPAVYQPRRGDMEVQFVNALRDPNGNTLAEPGIDRVNRNTRGWTAPPYTQGYINSTIKTATSWDPDRYINIWVMDLGGGLLGYAQFPDNTANLGGLNTLGGSAATDGVVILYSAYGSRAKFAGGIYSSPYDRGRTLTHELGHWFGFRHIWGDAACGDDYCTDTPTQQKENYGCVAFPQITCNNVTGDMSMNYMDYSNDACMYMFTQAQKDRLQAIMVNSPRRAPLASSNVACPVVVPATASNSGVGCIGSSATLSATGPAGATYAWTGPNGFTSTAQNPTLTNLTVAAAGTYKVTVTVATGTACPGVATTTLAVNPTPATPTITPSATAVCPGAPVTLAGSAPTSSGTLPSTDFNSGAPTGWAITNTGAPATTWQYTTGNTLTYPGLITNFSFNGSRFAYAVSDAGGQGSVTNTLLTSPTFSTVGYSALSLSFQQILVVDSGSGAVEISTNGGTTWTPIATYTEVNPAATSTINLAGYLNQPTVQLRWHYTDTWGYLWAIDNVAFTGTPATYTYAWSLVSGNGLPTATNTSSISVTPTQNSVYRLSVSFAGGSCASSSTVNVNVYPTPTIVTSASLACPGSPATLSATNLAGFSPTYAWTLVSGDGLPAVTTTPTLAVTPTQNSVYRLTVTYPGGCSFTSAPVSVTVVPTPAVVASASVVCAGSPSQLSATNIPTTGYTYAWTLVSGDGLPATVNTPTISVTPTQASVYRLTVSTGGCSASSTVSVTGITNQIDAYPVPFGDAGLSLKVSTCTAGPASVQIYDIMGRRVYESTVGAPQVGITSIDMPETSRLRPGKYIVKVQQGTQNTTFNVVRQ